MLSRLSLTLKICLKPFRYFSRMSKTDFKSHTAGFENFKKQSKLEECQNGAKAWAWAFRSPSEFFQFFAATLKTLRTDNEKTFELVQT